MKVCIVIPTFNERENIQQLIPLIQKVLRESSIISSSHILIVDDNSPDGTGRMAEELAQTFPNIHVIHRPQKLGIGSALKDGFEYALSKLNADIIIQMDADLSHHPAYIPRFIAKIREGYDVVIGSRRVSGGRIVGWSLYRHVISYIANKIAQQVLRLNVQDCTSGYRAFTQTALHTIQYSTLTERGYALQIEVLYRCQQARLRIGEIPITFHNRKHGETKLQGREILAFLLATLKIPLYKRLGKTFYP